MTEEKKDNLLATLMQIMQMVNENGIEAVAETFRILLNEASLLRLVSAVLMELSEEWETGKRYLNMDVENGDFASEQNEIYRKNVA